MPLRPITPLAFLLFLPDRERPIRLPEGTTAWWGRFGNFTVAQLHRDGKIFVGVSKRNPTDSFGAAGLRIAITRAWRDMQDEKPGYGRKNDPNKDRKRSTYLLSVRGDENQHKAGVGSPPGIGRKDPVGRHKIQGVSNAGRNHLEGDAKTKNGVEIRSTTVNTSS